MFKLLRICLLSAAASLVIVSGAAAQSHWLEPRFAFPVPGHDIGRDRLGAAAGGSLELDPEGRIGVGFDLAYHYWPASAGYRAAFDRFLASETLTQLASSDYAFSALQVTPHVRIKAVRGGPVVPWVQAGAGAYLVDPNVEPADWSGGVLQALIPQVRTVSLFGWYAGAGIDFRPSRRLIVGLDAAVHFIAPRDARNFGYPENRGPRITAMESGIHMGLGI